MPELERCACGQPLHYPHPSAEAAMRLVVTACGPLVRVETDEGAWEVPRHYVALHGLKAQELPLLADQLGFRRVLP